jgi:hypothetical protein
MMGNKDGRQIAKENEIRVLRALHRFGWLHTRDLAGLCWQRLIITSQAPDGSIISALSEGGVRVLKDAGITAISGKDLVREFSSAYFRHRCIANEIAISGIAQGFRTSTERETAQGLWLGGKDGIQSKRPDVLLRSGNQVWWVEVKRSRKNKKDYAALLIWLTKVLRNKMQPGETQLLGQGVFWAKVVFICTLAFQVKLLLDLKAARWKKVILTT